DVLGAGHRLVGVGAVVQVHHRLVELVGVVGRALGRLGLRRVEAGREEAQGAVGGGRLGRLEGVAAHQPLAEGLALGLRLGHRAVEGHGAAALRVGEGALPAHVRAAPTLHAVDHVAAEPGRALRRVADGGLGALQAVLERGVGGPRGGAGGGLRGGGLRGGGLRRGAAG
ncbi:MAG: hypothetical protein ACK559_21580, partial [bacterium]